MRSFLLSALALPVAALPSVATAAIKVAVVDVQAVMNSTNHWKKAVEKLESDRKAKQAVLESKQRELRERKEKLDAKKAVSAADATIKEEEALFQDAQQLTQQFMQQQKELSAWEQRITSEMLQRVELVVREVSLRGDYEFVFEQGSADQPNVLYADDSVDITKQVIALYKKRYKDKPLKISKR